MMAFMASKAPVPLRTSTSQSANQDCGDRSFCPIGGEAHVGKWVEQPGSIQGAGDFPASKVVATVSGCLMIADQKFELT